jgi:hypothetical protein
MNIEKTRKYKEFLVLLLRNGQTKINVTRKNLRIIMGYFDLKNENTATRYLKEMENADMLVYDLKNNCFNIRPELDNKSKITKFQTKK